MDNKIKQLEEIMKLMQKYQVDHVDMDGLKVNKAYHDFASPDDKPGKVETDEDLLFYSSAP